MRKLTKLTYIAFLLNALLLISCGKEDLVGPDKDFSKASNQQCNLMEIRNTNGSSVFAYTATYNNNGRIIRVDAKNDGVLDLYRVVEYNAAGKISKVTSLNKNNAANNSETYEYNSAGLLRKSSYFNINPIAPPGSPLIMNRYYIYEYNSDNKPTKLSHFNSQNNLVAYSDYTYPSGTTVQVEYFAENSGFLTSAGVAEYTFDNEKSPGLLWGVLYGQESNHFESFPNNVLSIKYPVSGAVTHIVNTYEYNSEGFPTKVTSTENGKARSIVTTFIYNCQ